MNVISNKIARLTNYHVANVLNFFMGSICAVLCSFLATFLLNANLSKEEMGYYSYVFTLLSFCYPILSLSLFNGYPRFIEYYQSDRLIHFVHKMSWVSTLIFVTLIMLYFNSRYFAAFAFIILYQERLLLARAQLQIAKYNFLNIVQKLIFLALLFLYYLTNHLLSANSALFFMGSSYLISYFISYFWKENCFVSSEYYQEFNKNIFLKFCFFTMLTSTINWILIFSDQVIIKYFYSYEALAPYAVAYRIVSMLGLISGVFLSYYPTVYFKKIKEGKGIKEILLLRKYFIQLLLVTTLIIWLAKPLVYKLFGASNYLAQSNFFGPLLLGEVFRIMGTIVLTFLTYKLKQLNILALMFFISILNSVLNILFVPIGGPIVSAYSTLLCFILYFVFSLFISYIPECKHLKSITITDEPNDTNY